MIDPIYFKYLIALDTLIIHTVFFVYQMNHFLDEIKDIFMRFFSDKNSSVQKKKTVLLSSKIEKKNSMQSQHDRIDRKNYKFSLNFSVAKREKNLFTVQIAVANIHVQKIFGSLLLLRIASE